MPVDSERAAALRAVLFDPPVAYHPVIARAVGSVTAGVLLSQLCYWTPRAQDPEGWIWKTQEALLEETGLTRREQETARRTLVTAGILEEKRAGVPARLYFRVDVDKLHDLLAAQYGGKRHSSMSENAQQEGRKTPNRHGANEQSNSESTSKTNSEKFIHDWKAELAATMTASNYRRWVAPLELVELVNHHAVLSAPDTSTADYARTRLADTLARALNVERIEIQTTKVSGP